MLPVQASEIQPLTVAPRPFEAEVLGGWIGRIAAQYRMSVQEFQHRNGLDFGLEGGRGWLLLDDLTAVTLEGLMGLMRMSQEEIQAIRRPPARIGPRRAFYYCPRCIFVNEADVTAPIWRQEWLDQRLTSCQAHGRAFRALKPGRVLACKNLEQLIALASESECSRQCRARNAITREPLKPELKQAAPLVPDWPSGVIYVSRDMNPVIREPSRCPGHVAAVGDKEHRRSLRR
jgi:hypothetical protein